MHVNILSETTIHKCGPPWMSDQHNVRVTTRDNTGQNTDKGHTPSPRIEIKILTLPGIEPRPPGWEAGTLPITPRRRSSIICCRPTNQKVFRSRLLLFHLIHLVSRPWLLCLSILFSIYLNHGCANHDTEGKCFNSPIHCCDATKPPYLFTGKLCTSPLHCELLFLYIVCCRCTSQCFSVLRTRNSGIILS